MKSPDCASSMASSPSHRPGQPNTASLGVDVRCTSAPGFTLIEVLITLTFMLLIVTSLLPVMVKNVEINKSQQLRVAAQSNARTCLSMIVQAMRSEGWNPKKAAFNGLDLDPDPTGTDNFITIRADFDEDGSTTSANEEITIRHHNNTIEWRKTSDTSQPFIVLADNISNDANGDGSIDAMFIPDSVTHPTMVTVTITAQSQEPDPRTRQYYRYTISSDVSLRENL